MTTIQIEIIERLVQLIFIVGIGGGISFLYTKSQKNKEVKISIIEQFSKNYGKFISLRYKYNIFHLAKHQETKPINKILSEIQNEPNQEKWNFYKDACNLLGEYQSVKPLILEYFKKTNKDVNDLHNHYQGWRRSIRDDKPIHQKTNWESTESYTKLVKTYSKLIKTMRDNI